jgi:hypothetical protein
METETMTETTNENPTSEASDLPLEAPRDPQDLGRLTPEEHQTLMRIRAESQQLLAKVGEHELLKQRILSRVEVLDGQGQEVINAVSQRLGLKDGQTWVGLQDGRIRLVDQNQNGQNRGGGIPPG